jgi:hypothetical protein
MFGPTSTVASLERPISCYVTLKSDKIPRSVQSASHKVSNLVPPEYDGLLTSIPRRFVSHLLKFSFWREELPLVSVEMV